MEHTRRLGPTGRVFGVLLGLATAALGVSGSSTCFGDDTTYTLPDGGQVRPPDTYATRTHGPTVGLTLHW